MPDAPAQPEQVLWRYSGVRPLYDDGTSDPSAVTRDYTLRVDDETGRAPVLSVYGGKITTYRRLAEHVIEKLQSYFPGLKGAWTSQAALPGSDFGAGGRQAAQEALAARYPRMPGALMRALFRRHGSKTADVLRDAKDPSDLGEDFGANLTEREVAYFVEHEWARTADDVLWRRTKAGLHMSETQRARVAQRMGEHATAR